MAKLSFQTGSRVFDLQPVFRTTNGFDLNEKKIKFKFACNKRQRRVPQSFKRENSQLHQNHKKEDLTEGCMGEQASLEFDLTFGDVLLHKLVQAY